MNGGDRVAEALGRHDVPFLFTLCGGHISPILVGARKRGIRVVDTRHEATAVFAADAVARLTGRPGVAAVTAGPGATNTVTAVKNAQMAQSPVVVLVGATATLLQGRGALQDMDQESLFAPHVKRFERADRVRDLGPAVDRAIAAAGDGVPGPVVVECPVDLLYPEQVVRKWYQAAAGRGVRGRLRGWYLGRHMERLFGAEAEPSSAAPSPQAHAQPADVRQAAKSLARAKRPLLVVGSPALARAHRAESVARAVEALGIPVYLSGMARGLLGRSHSLLLRHRRRDALREADLVLLAGVPCDFRLDYGKHIRRRACLISVNRSADDLRRNRKPAQAVRSDPGSFLRLLAEHATARPQWQSWLAALHERDADREAEIAAGAHESSQTAVNPVAFCRAIEDALPDNALLVADGGDFVATASYVVRPRSPLGWLDPGPFGTLGVGAGFALGAKLARPDTEVWILFGDGSLGYSLTELDTFVRHGVPVLAVVGNDASWAQIARDQVEILGDDVATGLLPTSYHLAAEGLGARGYEITQLAEVGAVLARARQDLSQGLPVLVNAHLASSEFRKGSLSM